MRANTMNELDFLGADGGKIALAFASGCIAAWAFLKTLFTSPLRSRVRDLEAALASEKASCREMELRLVGRIETLETILTFGGPLRAQIQGAISSLHNEIERKIGADEKT